MYETQYRFSGRLVYPRPWSESYHKLHKFNPSIETAYITMRKKHEDVNLQKQKKRKTSCIHVSSPYFLTIQSAHSYSLIYTSSNHMNLKKTIAEIKSRKTTDGRESETCTWRKASMQTTRTWSTMWRMTSMGSGWPPVPRTRRWRCGTSRRTGSGFALLGVHLQCTSQIN